MVHRGDYAYPCIQKAPLLRAKWLFPLKIKEVL
jgi:hypothetical protein